MRAPHLGLALLAILGLGCATHPTSPSATTAGATPPAAVEVENIAGVLTGTTVGAWDLQLGPGGGELTPVRSAASLADNFLINAGFFFTVSPDPNALQVEGIRWGAGGEVTVDWGIRHPFKSAAQGSPRADLDGFDVRLAFEPRNQTPLTVSGGDMAVHHGFVEGPDGYTGALNQVESLGGALPFQVLDTGQPFNRFAQGTDYTPLSTPFTFGASEQVSIRVYLMCNWGISTTPATRLSPVYYNPEFNSKAAWRVETSITANTLTEGSAGTLDFTVAVADWNDSRGGFSVEPLYPNPGNLTGLRAASDVSDVTCFIPELSGTPLVVSIPTGGTGTAIDPLLYTFSAATGSAPAEGTYTALLKVTDSRTPNDNQNPVSSGVDAESDGSILFFDVPAYATYQVLSYDIAPGGPTNQAPTAVIATVPAPPVITTVQTVSFDGTTSSDPDGTLTTWEWDFDYQVGSPAFVDLGPTPTPQSFPGVGTYEVALRVTDDGAPGLSHIATVMVTVNPVPPVSCAGKAAWDSSTGGHYGNADSTGMVVLPSGRDYRVSDDGSTVAYGTGAGIGSTINIWRPGFGSFVLRPASDDPLTYGFRTSWISRDGSLVLYTDARAGANPPKDSWIQATTIGSTAIRISPNDGGTYEDPRMNYQMTKAIVYKRSGGQVFRVDPNGTNWTLITTASDGPAFLNSDATVAYVERTFNNLWSVNIDGSNPQLLRYIGNYFAVSADATKVVFDRQASGDTQRCVWVANLDGTGSPVLIHDSATEGYSAWFVSISCDGTWVGWGALSGLGGTYNTVTTQAYKPPTYFPGSWDGVNVGNQGEF